MMNHDYEAPRAHERIPFRVFMALFDMGTMAFFQGAFLQWVFFAIAPMTFFHAETFKMG